MRRPLVAAVVGLVAAAAAIGGAGAARWPGPAPSWLGGVALLALAGVAGVVATGGPVRRLVGGLLALAGAVALVAVVGDLAASAGPWLALLGAALLAAAGALVIVREPAMPRFGARYARTDAHPADPDKATWQAQDAGEDPTV